MKLYTKTGDDGETGLFGGRRVSKADPRVAAYGEVDEVNAWIGWALVAVDEDALKDRLTRIQSSLFDIGAILAGDPARSDAPQFDEAEIRRIEGWIDDADGVLPPLRNFVLPGGTELAARLHLTRTATRRAERAVVALSKSEPVDAATLVYLNRLSDYLFALARRANHRAGVADTIWTPARSAPEARRGCPSE
jgi:cob(I)alamin adenosyltransferase